MLTRRTLMGGTAALLGTVAAPQVMAQPKPVAIRAGYAAPPSAQFGAIFLAKPELLKHHGKSYTYEAKLFRSSSLQVTAMAANELDLGNFAFSTFHQAVVNAGVADLKIIGDEAEDGFPGYFGTQIRVNKDSGINSIAELKGKAVATLSIGSGIDFIFRYIVRQHGLEMNRDFTYLETPFPTMKGVLLNKKVDAAYFAQPFASDPEVLEQTKVLFRPGDILGPLMQNFPCVRASFVAQNRPVLVDFLEDFLRVVRWHYDPANRAEAIKIASEATKVPEVVFQRFIYTKEDSYRNPDGLPDLNALHKNWGMLKELGVTKQDLNANDYADLSMIKEAAARLKS